MTGCRKFGQPAVKWGPVGPLGGPKSEEGLSRDQTGQRVVDKVQVDVAKLEAVAVASAAADGDVQAAVAVVVGGGHDLVTAGRAAAGHLVTAVCHLLLLDVGHVHVPGDEVGELLRGGHLQ